MKKYKNISLFRWVKRLFMRMSNLQIILIVYLLTTFISASLLMTPYAQTGKEKVDFIDALFTAASAFSDTGLTTVTTATTWSWFGQMIIAILILVGGIGIFALKFWIINIIFKKSVNITSRNILEKERGSSNSGKLKKTIKISISFLFITILISIFVLWAIFYFEKGNFTGYEEYDPYHDPLLSFKNAVFHSISAINNAGFDILSGSSLSPYYSVYSIQIIFIILLIIGGIGFPVIYDVVQYINHKIRRRTDFTFSIFTKVSCFTYILVFLVGFCLTLIFEIGNKDGIWYNSSAGTNGNKFMAILFYCFSTRNAGFATLPNGIEFSEATLIVFSIMMFIGSSPSSTAGGLRTTTLAIIVVAIWNRLRGVDGVRLFKRTIRKETVYSSFIVLGISLFIIIFSTFSCYTSLNSMWGNADSSQLNFIDVFYETCSAYGTTGLSNGLTSSLNVYSKLVIIITMFIGQLGISSTMLVWRKHNPKNDYTYIKEDILIG